MNRQKYLQLVLEKLLKVKTLKQAYEVFWKIYFDNNVTCKSKCARNLKIVILNSPCYGYGDVIFAEKLASYLRKWYGATVKIATPQSQKFINLGVSTKNLIKLGSRKRLRSQCRRFRLLQFQTLDGKKIDVPKFDLILVAPVQQDYDVDRSDVKSLVPYSNIFNTFFFSEYNDYLDKNFDFPIGVGGKRLGIFLTTPKFPKRKLKQLKNPYAFIYIAEGTGGTIPKTYECFLGFAELVSKKYKYYKKFDIVIPAWIGKQILKRKKVLTQKLGKYFGSASLVTKKKTIELWTGKGNNHLTFRADIFPVPNKDMLRLIKYSVKDVLLTGDQSITDALSCCWEKNLFYQTAPWKEDLAHNLAKYMPNKYLLKKSTTCGTVKAIKYKSNYSKFVRDWDFRTRGKPKLDAVILSIKAAKYKNIKNLQEMILSVRSVETLKDNL